MNSNNKYIPGVSVHLSANLRFDLNAFISGTPKTFIPPLPIQYIAEGVETDNNISFITFEKNNEDLRLNVERRMLSKKVKIRIHPGKRSKPKIHFD